MGGDAQSTFREAGGSCSGQWGRRGGISHFPYICFWRATNGQEFDPVGYQGATPPILLHSFDSFAWCGTWSPSLDPAPLFFLGQRLPESSGPAPWCSEMEEPSFCCVFMKEISFFINLMNIKVTTPQLFLGMDITSFVISKIQQRLSWYSDLGWE